MLAYTTFNFLLSGLFAAQAHGRPGNGTDHSQDCPSSSSVTDPVINPVPGCGLLVDDMGIGHTTLGDQECRGIGRIADYMNIAAGCMCLTFREEGCRLDKPESWAYAGAGPRLNRDLKNSASQWYQCTTDPKWAQDWANRFVLYVEGPDAVLPTIIHDGNRIIA